MNKLLIFTFCFVVSLSLSNNAEAQLGKMLNKLKNKAIDSALGKPDSVATKNKGETARDPQSACKDALLILKLEDDFKIDYKEVTFSVLDDGTILIFDFKNEVYFTVKDGVRSGPYQKDSPQVKQFEIKPDDESRENDAKYLVNHYKGVIIPSDEKYSIIFNGKTYGPYAMISKFVQNQSKTKFVALVTKDAMMSAKQIEVLNVKEKNAKTEQEKMQLAMEMSELMQQNMSKVKGNMEVSPKYVSNVPVIKDETGLGYMLSNKTKYDDIIFLGPDKIMDLTGKTIKLIDPTKNQSSNSGFWLSSDNSKIASFDSGTLTLNDGSTLNEVFCPYLTKTDGKVYLSYMYFSPVNKAIMQCKIPF